MIDGKTPDKEILVSDSFVSLFSSEDIHVLLIEDKPKEKKTICVGYLKKENRDKIGDSIVNKVSFLIEDDVIFLAHNEEDYAIVCNFDNKKPRYVIHGKEFSNKDFLKNKLKKKIKSIN